MNKIGKIFCIIFIFALCCSNERSTKISTGQSLSADGIIKNTSLVFNFKPAKERFARNKDFFNFVYFEGDTICFSFTSGVHIDEKDIAVFFVNPVSGKKYPAERIDIIDGKRVAGFSLAGSILEHFFMEEIDQPFKTEHFAQAIPFIVKFEFKADEKNLPLETNCKFKINLQ